jgi:hypothetical protein
MGIRWGAGRPDLGLKVLPSGGKLVKLGMNQGQNVPYIPSVAQFAGATCIQKRFVPSAGGGGMTREGDGAASLPFDCEDE